MPRSEPTQATVICSSDSSTSIRPVTPIPSTIRVTRARASAASSDSSTASAADRVGGNGRDHLRGREADTEQTALALGHDLEVHGGLVESRVLFLELPQRCPLGLADRLAGRLDRDLLRGHG